MTINIINSYFETSYFNDWRESISVVFDVQLPEQHLATAFRAKVWAFEIADVIVADAHLGAQRYIRSSTQSRLDGMDHFVLNLYRTGGWKAQTKRGEFQGEAGQISLLDLTQDLISDEPPSDLVTVFVPRAHLETRLPDLHSLHGMAPTGPHAVLLAEFLEVVARALPTLHAGYEPSLSRALCDTVTACIQPSLSHLEAARPSLEFVLLNRAKRFINSRLDSSLLTIDLICNAIGVSRRTLFRLFENEGGVQHFILAKRLEHVRALLSDPHETRPISEVAAQYGFTRGDHFARAFKARFAHSPRDVRNTKLSPMRDNVQWLPAADKSTSFDQMLRRLRA